MLFRSNADVSASAAIDRSKLYPDCAATLMFYSYNYAFNCETQLTFNPDTTTLSVTGQLNITGTTTFNGVPYVWPSSQGAINTVLENDGNGNVSWSNSKNSTLSKYFTAGESLTKGQVVSINTGTGDSVAANNMGVLGWVSSVSTDLCTRFAMTTPSYIGSLTKINLGFISAVAGEQLTSSTTIYATTGAVSSLTPLAVSNVSTTIGTSAKSISFNFNTSTTTLNTNTTYYVVNCFPSNSELEPVVAQTTTFATSYSTDGGNSFTSTVNTEYREIYFNHIGTGDVFQANATDLNYRSKLIGGIAESSAATSTNVLINITGIDTNNTGLIIGGTYYVGNTNGVLSATAGINIIKVGKAFSTTTLDIIPSY